MFKLIPCFYRNHENVRFSWFLYMWKCKYFMTTQWVWFLSGNQRLERKSLRMTEKAKTPYLVNNARIKPCTCMFLIKIVFFLPKFVIETHRKCKKIFYGWRKQQKNHFDFQWTSPSSRQPRPRRDQRSTNKPDRVYCKYGLVTKSRAFPIFASQYIYSILC